MKILFKFGNVTIDRMLNDSKTAAMIYQKLPIAAKVNAWGEEIYFPIPVSYEAENPTGDVDIGDIAYWMEGKCLCIFFGRTPMSNSKLPKPALAVNIVGKALGDLSVLKNINSGDKVELLKT